MRYLITVLILLTIATLCTACGHAETELGNQLGCHLAGNGCASGLNGDAGQDGSNGVNGSNGRDGTDGQPGISCQVIKRGNVVDLQCGDQTVTLMACVEPNAHSNKCGSK